MNIFTLLIFILFPVLCTSFHYHLSSNTPRRYYPSWTPSSSSTILSKLSQRTSCKSYLYQIYGQSSTSSTTETIPKPVIMPISIDTKESEEMLSTSFIKDGKLVWSPTGYKTWIWKDRKINYLDVGGDDSKPPLLLVHGFGASIFHWRYNIPTLAEKFHVYAIDLLGFGLSDKPLIEYNAEVWRDQILAFIEEIIFSSSFRPNPIPCTVVGNSLGGFAALHATSADEKNLIKGCVLVNAAGRYKKFSTTYPVVEDNKPEWIKSISTAFQRFVINLSFLATKQPLRIEQVLRQVYPVNPDQVDDELVTSIQLPAQHPNAAEVFYRIITRNGNGPPIFIDDLLATTKVPLLLLWGEKDPWITPVSADTIQEIFPSAQRVNIDAGHCAHDESPQVFNEEIVKFMNSLHG